MLIFIYGTDIFSAKEKLEEVRRRFLEKNNGNSFLISSIEPQEFCLADFRNRILSSGFFAEKKVVILKRQGTGAKEQEENILNIIKKVPEEVTLVVWQQDEDAKFLKSKLGKSLLSEKYAFKFTSLSGNALISWIRTRAAQYECEIDNESAHLICDILGNDLWKIDLELNKICAYTIGFPTSNSGIFNNKVTKKVVERILAKEAEENIFKFIDALAVKNRRLALLCLDNEFRAGVKELAVLGMIARQIRILLQTKSIIVGSPRITKQELADLLSIHPYVAGKALAQARNFYNNELKNIYRGLLQIDMAIKTSSMPARAMFDRLIAKL